MSWFSHLAKKITSEKILVVHIGSASVVGALVETGSPVSRVVATVTAEIPVVADLTSEKFESEMQKALESMLASLGKLRQSPPDRTHVYFASPWYASQVRRAKMSRPTPFVVSQVMLDEMIAKELKAFTDEEVAASYNAGQPIRPIESQIVQVKLNGYPTASPVDDSARDLELSLFLSVAPEHTLKKVEETIGKHYHKPIAFSSFLSASFLVSRDHFPHEEGYLLIDVGGEITDVSLVRDGALMQTVSFPLGRNFILRKLSVGLKRSIAESLTICTLYAEKKVEDNVRAQCDEILKEAKDQWLDSFQKTLFSVSNELSIPNTIMLSVGTDIAPWFIETISREEFHQHSLTEKEFTVVVLDAQLFRDQLAFAEAVPRNPCIIIEALASLKK
jgi:hypothetical protein